MSTPRVLIRSEDSGVQLNLRDLWAYRELLYFLTWRDIKVRYKQTLMGAAWVIIQPLMLMLIFTLIFILTLSHYLFVNVIRGSTVISKFIVKTSFKN